MRKVYAFSILIIVLLTSCVSTAHANELYAFYGESHLTIDDRSFVLEDTPVNIYEDIVVRNFLYDITAEFDMKYEVLADIGSHSISIENQKESFADGCYVLSYIIHEITTLSEEQYNNKDDPMYYTKIHSAKWNELGPQWGDGVHNRSFIVGKSSGDDMYRIYDFGMM